MTSFKIACPHCGQRIAATSDDVGAEASCPTCQSAFVVPEPPSEQVAAGRSQEPERAASAPCGRPATFATDDAAAAAPKVERVVLISALLGAFLSGMLAAFPDFCRAWHGWSEVNLAPTMWHQIGVAILLLAGLFYHRVAPYWLAVAGLIAFLGAFAGYYFLGEAGRSEMKQIIQTGIGIDLRAAQLLPFLCSIGLLVQRKSKHLLLWLFIALALNGASHGLWQSIFTSALEKDSWSPGDRKLISPVVWYGFLLLALAGFVVFIVLLGKLDKLTADADDAAEPLQDTKAGVGLKVGIAGAILLAPAFYLNRFDAVYFVLVLLFEVRWIAALWLVGVAGRVSKGWGWTVLLVPFAPLIFLIRHWSASWRPFLLAMGATVLAVAAFFLVIKGGQSRDLIFDSNPVLEDLRGGHEIGVILAVVALGALLYLSRLKVGSAGFWAITLLCLVGNSTDLWFHLGIQMADYSIDWKDWVHLERIVFVLLLGAAGFVLWKFRERISALDGKVQAGAVLGLLFLGMTGAALIGPAASWLFVAVALTGATATLALALAFSSTYAPGLRPIVCGVALAVAQFVMAHWLQPLLKYADQRHYWKAAAAVAEQGAHSATGPASTGDDRFSEYLSSMKLFPGRVDWSVRHWRGLSNAGDPFEQARTEFYTTRQKLTSESKPRPAPKEIRSQLSAETNQRLDELANMKRWLVGWVAGAILLLAAGVLGLLRVAGKSTGGN